MFGTFVEARLVAYLNDTFVICVQMCGDFPKNAKFTGKVTRPNNLLAANYIERYFASMCLVRS